MSDGVAGCALRRGQLGITNTTHSVSIYNSLQRELESRAWSLCDCGKRPLAVLSDNSKIGYSAFDTVVTQVRYITVSRISFASPEAGGSV